MQSFKRPFGRILGGGGGGGGGMSRRHRSTQGINIFGLKGH